MSLQRQSGIIWRSIPLVIIGVLVAAVPTYLIVNQQPKVYEASSTLIVGQALQGANPDFNGLQVSQYLAQTYATVAQYDPVLQQVADRLGLHDTPAALRQRLRVAAADADAMLTISARDGDPARAASMADTMAQVLVDSAPAVGGEGSGLQASVDADLNAIREDITRSQADLNGLLSLSNPTLADDAQTTRLQDRLLQLRATYASLLAYSSDNATNRLTIIQPAVVPTSAVEPRPLYFALTAGAAGFMIAIAMIFLLNYRKNPLRDGEDIEDAVDLPIVGAIPWAPRSGRRQPPIFEPGSSIASAIDGLRINIQSMDADRLLKSIVVVSATSGEGRSTVAANLAVAFADAGRQVLLVDGDLRRPHLHTLFGIDNAYGLTNVLRDENAVVDALARPMRPIQLPELRILTTGKAAIEGEWWSSGQLERAITRIGSSASLVIWDSPPLDVGTSALSLASRADAALVVIRLGSTMRGSLQDSYQKLAMANAHVLGVVACGLKSLPRHTEPAGELHHSASTGRVAVDDTSARAG